MSNTYKAIVIGGSSGLIPELVALFSSLPWSFPLPIVVAAHIHRSNDGNLVRFYRDRASIQVKEAEDKEQIQSNTIYFAPPDYHLLIEPDESFTLNMDDKVCFARPSIDVLFQSAGFAFGENLIGVLMSGANYDGAKGICEIKRYGGVTVAQNPDVAEYPVMPQAAIDTGNVDKIMTRPQLVDFILSKGIP